MFEDSWKPFFILRHLQKFDTTQWKLRKNCCYLSRKKLTLKLLHQKTSGSSSSTTGYTFSDEKCPNIPKPERSRHLRLFKYLRHEHLYQSRLNCHFRLPQRLQQSDVIVRTLNYSFYIFRTNTDPIFPENDVSMSLLPIAFTIILPFPRNAESASNRHLIK